MSGWERLRMVATAALDTWRNYGAPSAHAVMADRYGEQFAWWAGTWRIDPYLQRQRAGAPRLYQSTRQLWRQADAIVSLYEQFVYQGDLATDGKPLPDGTRGAIPIDPQTGSEQTDAQLLAACAQLFDLWRWRQHMSLRPKFGAILGDVLTELVDDPARGTVLPSSIWPGYVVDLDLDLVGNVKRYTIEFQIDRPASTAYGQNRPAERYAFRKEVDKTAFRFYRDGKPYAYPDIGEAVQPNPYGFVPAIWDRHELVLGSDRGMSALSRTLNQTLELNSVLSHAMDYQRKQFAAPVGVKGAALGRRGGAAVMPDITGVGADPEALGLLPLGPDGEFVTVSFDVGKTTEMLNLVMDSILAESPEARYAQQLLQMTQVTGPGAERLLAPIVGKVRQARANYDPQTVKLLQMAVAMLGERLKRGEIPAQIVAGRPARYAAFAGFDLASYGRGLLDCSIPDRPVFASTRLERVQELAAIETLQSAWALNMAGVPPEEVVAMLGERIARAARFDAALTGFPDDEEAA